MESPEGLLVLADGSVFEGELFGAATGEISVASGEVVFNTVLSGYQEVISDPSYAGQIIAFTNPHIGNYGVNATDFESRGTFCRGVIVRDLARRYSNQRAEGDLDTMLRAHGVPGITGVDTRRLTRIIRSTGAMPGAFGAASETDLLAAARAEPGTDGVDLVAEVTTPEPYRVSATDPQARRHIVALDLGMKRNIARNLARLGDVTVLPATSGAGDILEQAPDGVFLSNGPGDPAATAAYAVPVINKLIETGTPPFGICLGHQMLGIAVGGKTAKMHQGHHGANHPVKDLTTGKVEITSMNHGFALDGKSLPANAEETHISLFDGSNCGIALKDRPVFSVQYHPEASPGPRDSHYLFQRFVELMEARRK
jgi:carbamoyl-phosphate synthase small subunit